jgi:hypothetical protein
MDEQQLINAGRQVKNSRLPIWTGNKDSFTAVQWAERVTRAKQAGTWDDDTTMSYVYNALREKAMDWFSALPTLGYDITTWDGFKVAFLARYDVTRTVRTAAMNLSEIRQGAAEDAADYIARVIRLMNDIQTLAPAALPQPAQPWSAEVRAVANFVALPANVRDAQIQSLMKEGARDAYNRLGMHLAIAGLKPHLRIELMKKNPANLREAFDAAQEAQKICAEPRRQGAQLASVGQTNEEEEEEEYFDAEGGDPEVDAQINALSARLQKLKQKQKSNKKKSGGGGGGPSKGGNPKKSGPAPSGARGACRYCNKTGHMQTACYARIQAGAPCVDPSGKPWVNQPTVNSLSAQQQQLQFQPQQQQFPGFLQPGQQSGFPAFPPPPFQPYAQSESGGGRVGAIWEMQRPASAGPAGYDHLNF